MFQSLLARVRALLAGSVGQRIIASRLRIANGRAPLVRRSVRSGQRSSRSCRAQCGGSLQALRSLLVPANRAPLDFLKHYASLIIVLTGLLALVWSGYQIAYPPLVITVAKLPGQLEQESWINPEMSRTLMQSGRAPACGRQKRPRPRLRGGAQFAEYRHQDRRLFAQCAGADPDAARNAARARAGRSSPRGDLLSSGLRTHERCRVPGADQGKPIPTGAQATISLPAPDGGHSARGAASGASRCGCT